jgi:hypothetical protein
VSAEAFENSDTLVEMLHQVAQDQRLDLLDDEETRWRLKQALRHLPALPGTRRAVSFFVISGRA